MGTFFRMAAVAPIHSPGVHAGQVESCGVVRAVHVQRSWHVDRARRSGYCPVVNEPQNEFADRLFTHMILIADSHVSPENGNVDTFFAMLDMISGTDEDVVFLGDILDLWIAQPRYETAVHTRFLAWCRAEKERRVVALCEGNHEFFVCRNHGDVFTWCAPGEHMTDGCLFSHGDLIDRTEHGYRVFRALTKNAAVHWLLCWVPGGPRLVQWIKRRLRPSPGSRPKPLPESVIRDYCRQRTEAGTKRIYAGHFHLARQFQGAPCGQLVLVPSWQDRGTVAHIDGDQVNLVPWTELG